MWQVTVTSPSNEGDYHGHPFQRPGRNLRHQSSRSSGEAALEAATHPHRPPPGICTGGRLYQKESQ